MIRIVKTINKDLNLRKFYEEIAQFGELSISTIGFTKSSKWIYTPSGRKPGEIIIVFHEQTIEPNKLDTIIVAHDSTIKSQDEQDRDSYDADLVLVETEIVKSATLSDDIIKAIGRIALRK